MRTSSLVFVISLFSSTTCGELQTGEDSLHNSTMTYDPGELLSKIFNFNSTIQGQSRNRFRFEPEPMSSVSLNHDEEPQSSLIVNFKSGDSVETQYAHDNDENAYRPTFIEDNRVEEGHQKRKKKRRKPRLHGQGLGTKYPGPYAPSPPHLGVGAPPYYGFGYSEPINRPPLRPRPSLASAALSSVTEALTSIALYDDKQCVARLLCEAASGGALGSSGTLQSVAGLQPLLTLLSAYSGISSNPLFVFGRAAFLGMSSKNNAASCRYGYPLCPTDPEQLVYYLNNHNGGFFRFFNAPQRGQQNINQFYNQLTQNYENQQAGFLSQHNGVSTNQPYQQNQIQDYNIQNSNLYTGNQGNYGITYPYEQNKYGLLNNIRFNNNDEIPNEETAGIQKRIQNRPGKYLEDFDDDLNFENANDHNVKWSFPETNNDHIQSDNVRVSKGLKFPENVHDTNVKGEDSKRSPRGFVFPGSPSNQYLDNKKYQEINPSQHKYNTNYNNLIPDINKGYNDNRNGYDEKQSVRTVYVVRGNGDPNRPEIVQLRPGQTVY